MVRDACEVHLDDRLSQGDTDRHRVARVTDPDPLHEVEMLHAARKRLCHDDRHVGAAAPLIVPDFGKPAVVLGLGPFGLPDHTSGAAAYGSVYLLHDLRARLAVADRLDRVPGEYALSSFSSSRSMTSLAPLRSLLCVSLQVLDRLSRRQFGGTQLRPQYVSHPPGHVPAGDFELSLLRRAPACDRSASANLYKRNSILR